MKLHMIIFAALLLCHQHSLCQGIPDCYREVDQVLWVVSDPQITLLNYEKMGFTQVADMGKVPVSVGSSGNSEMVRLIAANLGGARVNWIQPLDEESVFKEFQRMHGDGAMSLVHRFPDRESMNREVQRLENLGIGVMENITIRTGKGTMHYVLMSTRQEGKYILGFTFGESGMDHFAGLTAENRHQMRLNQYAFAIRDPEPVSRFWETIGLPELQISHPELGDPMYYGEPADHDLIQGWQRHGTIAYEWCIPLKPPIVYEDHIKQHGEGIHHLAFSVSDMDRVLEDYTSRGFVVSMGGTWGEKGKPGSGRYEYIDLEEAGGLTMELLWNFSE